MNEIEEHEDIKDSRRQLLRAKLLTALPEFNLEAKEILERVLKDCLYYYIKPLL